MSKPVAVGDDSVLVECWLVISEAIRGLRALGSSATDIGHERDAQRVWLRLEGVACEGIDVEADKGSA